MRARRARTVPAPRAYRGSSCASRSPGATVRSRDTCPGRWRRAATCPWRWCDSSRTSTTSSSDGAEAVVLDLERANARDVAEAIAGADAVVFAAGAGPGSGIARKDTVDRAAAGLLADGAEQAGVRRYVLVSSMGAGAPPPPGTDEVFAAYLVAKRAAELDLRTRDLDWTILRPGGLTDDAADRVGPARRLGAARLGPPGRRRRGPRRAAARAAHGGAGARADRRGRAHRRGGRRRHRTGRLTGQPTGCVVDLGHRRGPQRDRADEVLVAGGRRGQRAHVARQRHRGANPLASVPSELVARQPVAVESNALRRRAAADAVPLHRCGAERAAPAAPGRCRPARAGRRCRSGRPPTPPRRCARSCPPRRRTRTAVGTARRADPLRRRRRRSRTRRTPGRRTRRRATSRRSTSGPCRCASRSRRRRRPTRCPGRRAATSSVTSANDW